MHTTTGRLRRARTALRAAAVAAVAAALTTAGLATPAAAADRETLSGVYGRGARVATVQEFERWRGRDAGVVMDFVDGRSWETIRDAYAVQYWAGRGYETVYSVPMLPEDSGSMRAGADGAYDRHFAEVARVLVATGQSDAVVRIGWEMNGRWFRWSAVADPGTYVAYWRSIVDAMRAVPGASDLRFEWSPQPGDGAPGFVPTRAYPGDAYVDVIGNSLYDQSWGHSPSQREQRWRHFVSMPYGLEWTVGFARSHDKELSLPEWGLSHRCDGNGGNDDPYFIERVAQWTDEHDYLYETYYDYTGPNPCDQQFRMGSGRFPAGAAAYREHFGSGASADEDGTPSRPAPAPAPAPAPGVGTPSGDDELRVSWSSDRARSQPLEWMGVSARRVFVTARTASDVERVRFYLDDPDASGTPLGVDASAPFDLRGGTASRALPWDARGLSGGRHTLTAVLETASGSRTLTVPFLSR
ncbi:glycosyl hydrolase [Cellulomonas endophytica]|uniref:glycosyl hydrolase n=1 Tax=Cellulomonas endophytica TaxID=2494735 RepID=UPI0010101C7A|nr:glycosyl hydrolase [Cellulomonas endophytica]